MENKRSSHLLDEIDHCSKHGSVSTVLLHHTIKVICENVKLNILCHTFEVT